MLTVPLFAQMNAFNFEPGQFFLYLAFTIGLLGLVWFLNKWTRPLGVNLILWGILTEVFSLGYGMIAVPTAMMVTPVLSKIGFLLVLGGVASCLFASFPDPPGSKEADHV